MFNKFAMITVVVAVLSAFTMVPASANPMAGPLSYDTNPAYRAAVILNKTEVMMGRADAMMAEIGIGTGIDDGTGRNDGDLGFPGGTMSIHALYKVGKEYFDRAWFSYQNGDFRASIYYSKIASHYFFLMITGVE
jgi:hypothetical protein